MAEDNKVSYGWVVTPRQWRGVLDRLDAIDPGEPIVIDLETPSLKPYDPNDHVGIVLAAITLNDGTTWSIPLSHPDSPAAGFRWRMMVTDLCQTLAERRPKIINANLRFDLLWLYRFTGIDLIDLLAWDTMIVSHLTDENKSSKLKEDAARTFGIERWDEDIDLSNGAHRVDMWKLGHYAARDTYWTWRLCAHQSTRLMASTRQAAEDERADAIAPSERVDAQRSLFYHYLALPAERTLHLVERNGMGIDLDRVDSMLAEREAIEAKTYEALRATDPGLFDQWGDDDVSLAPTSNFFREWTTRAVERGDLRVTARTPTGLPKWDKTVLIRQARAGSEVATTLLEWRKANTASQFLRSWPKFVSPADGRIHPSYRSVSTVTGRLSCAEPNVQQVSYPIKPAWVAGPGTLLMEVDYSQIEMRVAAHVARCQPMIEALRANRDLHSMMAATIIDKAIEDVEPEERQAAKAVNFGFLYGMMPPGFVDYALTAYGVDYTLREAEAARAAYFDLWDGLEGWHTKFARIAQTEGVVASPLGRLRHVPDAQFGNQYQASSAIRRAINSPIQSMASDLTLLALAMVAGLAIGSIPVRDASPVGTVHDSLLIEVARDRAEAVAGEVLEIMTDRVPRYVRRHLGVTLDVPLSAEAVLAERWGDEDSLVIERVGRLVTATKHRED